MNLVLFKFILSSRYNGVLPNYLKGVSANFKDSRVVQNVTDLAQNIIEHKSSRLWSISEDKAEFERSKRLLDGWLKSVLDDEKI